MTDKLMIHCDSAEQHAPKMGEHACKRADCPGEREWETGYGLAGGGCGVYNYCNKCEQIVGKMQDEG